MKYYFFERKDGKVFAAQGREADLVKHAHKLIGVSDGSKYESIIKESRDKLNTIQTKMRRYTENTPPIPVPEQLHIDLFEAREEFNAKSSEAFQAELEAARGHLEDIPDTKWNYADEDAKRAVQGQGIKF